MLLFSKYKSALVLFLFLAFFSFSWVFSNPAFAVKESVRVGETATNNGGVSNATFAPDGTSWWSGNSFETAGTSTFGSTGGKAFSLVTGLPTHTNYPRLPLNAQTVISDNAGGWYVAGGNTSTFNEAPLATLLLHILPDGTLDPTFNAIVTTTISAMALRTSTLYIGGSFVMVNGVARNRLAAVNATTGALLDWNPNVNNAVSAITLDPTGATTTIFVGGSFTSTTGNVIRRRAAAWDPNGALTSWNPDMGSGVNAIAFDPTGATSSIFVGGSFTTTTASSTTNYPRNRLAVFNPNGSLVDDWTPSFDNAVLEMAFDAQNVTSSLFVVGSFTIVSSTNSVASTTMSRLVAIDRSGNLVTSWRPMFNGQVSDVMVVSSTVYGSGSSVHTVTSTNGSGPINRFYFFGVDYNGDFTSINLPITIQGNDFAISGNEVFVAGFDFYTSVYRAYDIYSMNPDGSLNMTFGFPHVSSSLTDSIGSGNIGTVFYDKISDIVYVGGSFQAINGVPRNNLAALDRSGNVLAWNPGANSTINVITTDPTGVTSSLFIGGDFTDVNSSTRSRLAAVDRNGVLIGDWAPMGASSSVNFIDFDRTGATSSIFIGGTFTKAAEQTRNRVAAFDRNGNLTHFNPNVGSTIEWMQFDPTGTTSSLFISGSFTTVNTSTSRNRLAAVDLNGVATHWNPNANGTVNDFFITTGTLYATGSFNQVNSTTRNHFVALNIATGTIQNWAPVAIQSSAPNGVYGFNKTRLVVSCGSFCSPITNRLASGLVEFDASLLSFSTTDQSVAESAGSVTLNVAINTTSTDPIEVYITAAGGTALSGSDFSYTAATATIAAGSTTTSVQFTLTDDQADESDETVVFYISNYAGALISESASSTVTISITDDDEAVASGGGGYSAPLVASPEPVIVVVVPSTTPPTTPSSTLSTSTLFVATSTIPITIVAPTVSTSVPVVIPKAPVVFGRSLKRGMNGIDVMQLQKALNTLGFSIAKSGPGSRGKETKLFGIATDAAVRRFQEAYKKEVLIPVGLKKPTGLVGARTQDMINRLLRSSL